MPEDRCYTDSAQVGREIMAGLDQEYYFNIQPNPSLEKHYKISEAFQNAGYDVVMGDPYGSKRVWWAYRRKGAAAVTENLLKDHRQER